MALDWNRQRFPRRPPRHSFHLAVERLSPPGWPPLPQSPIAADLQYRIFEQQLVYTKHNVDFQPIELAICLGSAPIPETPLEVLGIPADLAGKESLQPTSD
jgi:hypothetical protein